jgi:DNA polymerase-3 subunit gamma/tau
MAQALYRKWRPQTWDEVVGQPHVIQTLRNAVKGERVAHAYLFAGPRGTGKTSTARLLAKAVNCLAEDPADRPCNKCSACVAVNEGRFLDLIEIDAASNTSVEDVRDLRDKINFAPNEGRAKVYIVDEVHMLSTAAFNALLKTLEEPPQHAIFVLATTEVHKIPATVLSRCQRHEFRRLPVKVISDYLAEQAANESIDAEPAALEVIARQATGSFRDAISLLDQLASTGETVTLQTVQAVLGTAASQAVQTLVGNWIESKAGEGLTLINDALDGGADARQLARQTVDYLRNLLMVKMGNHELLEISAETRQRLDAAAEQVSLARLLAGLEAFSSAASESRSNWQPALPLELAFLESLASSSTAAAEPKAAGTKSSSGDAKAGSAPPAPEPESQAPSTPLSSTLPKQVNTEAPSKGGSDAQPPAALSGPLTFQVVLDRWRDILAATFERDPRAQALLNSGQPLGLKNDTLVIGFASDLLREKMDKGETLKEVSTALEHVLGRPMGVQCVLSDNWDQAEPAPGDPVMEDGGMVDTAVRELGAEVSELDSGAGASAEKDEG